MSATKKKAVSVMDELGGSTWLQAYELRTDDKAGAGQTNVLALAREEVRKGRPNRALIRRRGKEPGYQIEYWRVDGDDAEVTGERVCRTVEAVKAELVENFGAKEPVIIMSW